MQISYLHNNRGRFFQKAIKSTLVLLVLFTYLVIPFKNQFLYTAHLVSHVALYETPHHPHDHHATADHHHEYLSFINEALNDQDTAHPIPVELTNYQFQIPLLNAAYHLSEYLPPISEKTFHTLFIPILTGPSFDVPVPPP